MDIYDALRSKRPYKPAYSHKKTLSFIREKEKEFFDPEIFTAFMDNAGICNTIFEENQT